MGSGSEIWQVTQPIGAADKRACRHLGLVRALAVDRSECRVCRDSGGTWVNLLSCLVCGAVGCCDSSPGRHAYAHFVATGHPLARTLKKGEDWGWCYVDQVFLEPRRVPPGAP